jgi:hypothetical protein
MDEPTLRAALTRYWELSGPDPEAAHAIYHEDAILEFPQSGERFVGKRNFLEWRSRYPADVGFELGRIRGRDDLWVAEVKIRYDDGPWNFGLTILELRDDLIALETIYMGEAWEAPEWRAEWRAAP